jgi:hypothetical protein
MGSPINILMQTTIPRSSLIFAKRDLRFHAVDEQADAAVRWSEELDQTFRVSGHGEGRVMLGSYYALGVVALTFGLH